MDERRPATAFAAVTLHQGTRAILYSLAVVLLLLLPTSTASALTRDDLFRLKAQHVADDTLIPLVAKSEPLNLTAEDVAQLKTLGVGEALLKVLVDKGHVLATSPVQHTDSDIQEIITALSSKNCEKISSVVKFPYKETSKTINTEIMGTTYEIAYSYIANRSRNKLIITRDDFIRYCNKNIGSDSSTILRLKITADRLVQCNPPDSACVQDLQPATASYLYRLIFREIDGKLKWISTEIDTPYEDFNRSDVKAIDEVIGFWRTSKIDETIKTDTDINANIEITNNKFKSVMARSTAQNERKETLVLASELKSLITNKSIVLSSSDSRLECKWLSSPAPLNAAGWSSGCAAYRESRDRMYFWSGDIGGGYQTLERWDRDPTNGRGGADPSKTSRCRTIADSDACKTCCGGSYSYAGEGSCTC